MTLDSARWMEDKRSLGVASGQLDGTVTGSIAATVEQVLGRWLLINTIEDAQPRRSRTDRQENITYSLQDSALDWGVYG
jgi:hypothetical protein